MRDKISTALLIVIVALLVIGFIALLGLGLTAIVSFAGATIPFGFAFLIAAVLMIALVVVTEGVDVE